MIASVPELLVTSSALILALLVLRWLLRGRISRRVQYSLWGLVAVRLLLPFSLPAESSVMNLPAARQAETVLTGQVARVQAGAAGAWTIDGKTSVAAAAHLPILLTIWLVGAAIAAIWFALVNLRFAHTLRASRKPMATLAPLPVYRVPGLASPCLFGLVRPAIYLPDQVTGDPEMLRHILIHEECHWRQKDHWWALVRTVCLCVYWFDPLVWIAASVSRRDCECACDERAVQILGQPQRIAYGHTLVAVVRRMHGSVYPGCTATTMSAGRRELQRRLALIVSGSRTRAWAAALLAISAALLIGCTFTGKNAAPQQTLTESESGTEPAAALSTYYVTFGSEAEDSAFDLRLLLPDGWEIRTPDSSLNTSVELYHGEALAGTLQYSRYTPYTEEPVPPEEEYKTVYTDLRLSRVEIWDPYTAVKQYEQGESGIADVVYMDPDYMQKHPDANWASVPEIATKGLLCFNRELGVYIALRLDPYQIPEQNVLEEIAASLQIGEVGTM